MAVIKAIGGGSNLRRVINYVLNPSKTRPELIGGWNVDPENAYEEMMATKRQWGKTGGRAYKHFTQSFAPDDGITPQEAFAIAAELVERSPMFRDYEVVYAVHVDRDHIHTHFVCNTVDTRTGKKFRYSKPDLQALKNLSDEIVKAHGFRLAHERPETDNVTAWDAKEYQVLAKAHAGEKISWEYDLAVTVQDVMQMAEDRDAFIQEMQARGYSVRWGERSITYITPDGNKRRASKLEDTFKLASVREKYADREAEQNQLRADLADIPKARPKTAPERKVHPPEDPIDYDLYNLDLRRSYDGAIRGRTRAQQRYETACAVCRQLRGAASAEDFELGMRIGGYQVDYDLIARDYIFRHPMGGEFSGSELAVKYHLPPLADAIDYLIMRPRVQPGYDGYIVVQRIMLQRDLDAVCAILTADRRRAAQEAADIEAASEAGRRAAEQAEAGKLRQPAEHAASRQHTCAQMDMYVYPDSAIWDDEMRAAALVLGQAICDPETLDRHLTQHGYAIRQNAQVTYLATPRGRKIILADSSPEPAPDKKEPFKIGRISVMAGNYMYGLLGRRSHSTGHEILELAAGAVLGAAALIETVARLIGRGLHVVRHRREGKKDDYELISDNASILLSQAFRRVGITPQFPETTPVPVAPGVKPEEPQIHQLKETKPKPAPGTESAKGPAKSKQPAAPEQPASGVDELQQLLAIVKKASVATDRESFEELLREQGCAVRWTPAGTLSFVLPGRKNPIRSSRLEKRYNLPSISAAYGQEREAPTSGARYDAAQAVRSAAATSAGDPAAFDAAMVAAGYEIRWKPDRTDATIIAPDTGQHMRLSSLVRRFGLQISLREASGVVQYYGRRQGGSETGDAGDGGSLDGLKRAIAAARDSVAPREANRKNPMPRKSARRSRTRTAGERRDTPAGDTRHARSDQRGRSAGRSGDWER